MLTGSAHDGGFGILRVSLIAFFLSLWFTTAGAENAFEDRGVRFLLPREGEVVRPGQAIEVRLQPDPGIPIRVLHVTLGHMFGDGGRDVLVFRAPPLAGTMHVPDSWSGPLEIVALGWGVDPESNAASEEIAASLLQAFVTLEVVVEGKPVALDWMNPPMEILELDGEPRRARGQVEQVEGVYPNGQTHRLPQPGAPLGFLSNDESVVTVDADGNLTAQGAGITYITVKTGDVEAFYEVRVDRKGSQRPAIDVTDRVRIELGPLYREPEPDQMRQRVTVTNLSSLPLPQPLVLTIRGLRSGVHSLEGEWVYMDDDSPHFIAPGASAWADLQFRVWDNQPFGFACSVYAGGPP